MLRREWKELGYINEPLPANIDLKAEIRRLCKEKNAVILAHYYTDGTLQEIADFVGDSLALARKAAETDADIIAMCGVHFMGETCKILCPDKKVLIPDLNASCSLAESCPADDFRRFVEAHPDHKVISYVNTTAATKTVTDVVVTSGNARQIVESFPKDQKLIFGPDRNLGEYINSVTGADDLPVILAYGVGKAGEADKEDGLPLVAEETSEGYDPAFGNKGGPVRFVMGQTDAEDVNSGSNMKFVKSIEVTAFPLLHGIETQLRVVALTGGE